MIADDGLFSSVWSYFGIGGGLVVIGAILLIAARRAEPGNRKTLRRIGWPMLGCGGCLVSVPLIVIGFFAIFGMAVVTLCADNPGC